MFTQSKKSTNCVYVSGLPDDITVNELYEQFKVAGAIQKRVVDLDGGELEDGGAADAGGETEQYKIKLYVRPDTNPPELTGD